MSDRIARRLVVEGRVQGVSYRDWTLRKARAFGLDGWVRNRADGSVEILLCGPERAVADMIAACRRGPPLARVDGVRVAPAETPAAPGFARLPDA